ncbi:MAG: PIG-L family deacetylase [Planctomycetes bacterium]|nr:PIG-L family deacetylase [Planctomycetota bacterium]
MKPHDWSHETRLDPPRLPKILDEPPARGKILVVAPHADDETIGVGGIMAMHQELGDPMDVLVLTTGITGNAGKRYPPEEYIRIRREEAQDACRVLGVRETIFWDYPDNHHVSESDMDALVAHFIDLLNRKNYEVIYTPHRGEMHSDHHVAAVMTARSLVQWKKPLKVFGYEIWAPLEAAEMVVNVTRTYSKKLEAGACYKSQIADNDIVRLFKCLNGYRSAFMEQQGRYGEALVRIGIGHDS